MDPLTTCRPDTPGPYLIFQEVNMDLREIEALVDEPGF